MKSEAGELAGGTEKVEIDFVTTAQRHAPKTQRFPYYSPIPPQTGWKRLGKERTQTWFSKGFASV